MQLGSVGFRPGKPMALVAGASEAGAGLLLALGLLTPLASVAVIGTLVVAGSAVLAFTGPGAYSLDGSLGLDGLAGNGWGVAAVVAGALSGLAVVARARRALAGDAVALAVTPEHVPA